ncbi:hypothetical protein EZV62_001821 [Acer yangbiense]|uniref:RING-type domain-containing protein n=1 Tax=Acer yangbiense TaxID=1000413 RepID=A0A5C7IXF6_9ROSI|nr:hypothetical protein EZV62_001821 [Acer yangbiense]
MLASIIPNSFNEISGLEMNWNPHVEVHYYNTSYPYNSAGSFMEYFEGLTYEHVNFIFDGASHVQESAYPSMNTSFYKFGLSESGNTSYYDYGHPYEVNYHEPRVDENRRPSDNSSTMNNEQTASVNTVRERNTNTTTHENSVECPRRHHNAHDYQVVWQDSVDPDNMTYEAVTWLNFAYWSHLSLARPIGQASTCRPWIVIGNGCLLNVKGGITRVRRDGWNSEQRSFSRTYSVASNFKIQVWLLWKKKVEKREVEADESLFCAKGRLGEQLKVGHHLHWMQPPPPSEAVESNLLLYVENRCVICQMEYKRGDRRITLPCKHAYHAGCGARWLSINKACPICYTEVYGDTSKR